MRQNLQVFFSLMNAAIARQQVEVTLNVCVRTLLVLSFLRTAGYINGFILKKPSNKCTVLLKYMDKRPVLKQLIPVSKPGRKVFCSMFSLRLYLGKVTNKPFGHPRPHLLPLIFSDGRLVPAFHCLKTWRGGEVVCLIAA